jgi:hypothetical protein
MVPKHSIRYALFAKMSKPIATVFSVRAIAFSGLPANAKSSTFKKRLKGF